VAKPTPPPTGPAEAECLVDIVARLAPIWTGRGFFFPRAPDSPIISQRTEGFAYLTKKRVFSRSPTNRVSPFLLTPQPWVDFGFPSFPLSLPRWLIPDRKLLFRWTAGQDYWGISAHTKARKGFSQDHRLFFCFFSLLFGDCFQICSGGFFGRRSMYPRIIILFYVQRRVELWFFWAGMPDGPCSSSGGRCRCLSFSLPFLPPAVARLSQLALRALKVYAEPPSTGKNATCECNL